MLLIQNPTVPIFQILFIEVKFETFESPIDLSLGCLRSFGFYVVPSNDPAMFFFSYYSLLTMQNIAGPFKERMTQRPKDLKWFKL